MLSGFVQSFRVLRSALFRRVLRRAVRLGLMLGPMIGPLASSAAGAELFPVDPWSAVTDVATIDGLTGVGDAARWRRATSWAASGAEFAAAQEALPAPSVAAAEPAAPLDPELAALTAAAPLDPELAALTAAAPPSRGRLGASVELVWLSGAGLAVHPVRSASVSVAAGPQLPSLAPVVAVVEPAEPVRTAEGLPALSIPEPLPVFAALLPPAGADGASGGVGGGEPAARRTPLIAGRPASPAARQARRATGRRLVEGPPGRPQAAARAVTDALARFLAATAPGTWAGLEAGGESAAAAAARTAGASGTDGPRRR